MTRLKEIFLQLNEKVLKSYIGATVHVIGVGCGAPRTEKAKTNKSKQIRMNMMVNILYASKVIPSLEDPMLPFKWKSAIPGVKPSSGNCSAKKLLKMLMV